MRLDRFLAHAGWGTRKEVRELLKHQNITVNGAIVTTPGHLIREWEDVVEVHGSKITYRPFTFIMLHKPQGYISACEDARDPTVLDLIGEPYRDLFPVGRLDKDTTGLLLLCNHGRLTHFLLSPRSHVEKEYEVTVDLPLKEELIAQFAQGMTLPDGTSYQPCALIIHDQYHASIVLKEGKYHQIKRMFLHHGYHVTSLHRTRMDRLTLGDLPLGQYRLLTDEEIGMLMEHLRGV